MKSKVYCIKDVKVGFMQPFLQPNDAVAIREFGNIVNNTNNLVATNYQDMQLFRIGEFCTDTGELSSEVSFVVNGVDVKEALNV